MLNATYENQVESLLAYINSLNGSHKSMEEAGKILTEYTGISSNRKISRMSGNSAPHGDLPDAEFLRKLRAAHEAVFRRMGFEMPAVSDSGRFYSVATKVFHPAGVLYATCPNVKAAAHIAASLNDF